MNRADSSRRMPIVNMRGITGGMIRHEGINGYGITSSVPMYR